MVPLSGGKAARHDRELLRRGHPEGEVRLVRGVVVAGEHAVRGVGLVRHRETVGGGDPAAVGLVAGGVARVPDGDPHGRPVRERDGRVDDQVLPGGGELRRQAVDLDGAYGAAGEVEIDPVQGRRGPCVDGGDGVEGLGVAALVGERDVVREDVVARVAEVREQTVADAERLGCGQGGGDEGDRRGGQQSGTQSARGERHGLRLPARTARAGGARRTTRTGSTGRGKERLVEEGAVSPSRQAAGPGSRRTRRVRRASPA